MAECIDKDFVVGEINDLMKSSFIHHYENCGPLHAAYVEKKETCEIIRDSIVKAAPTVDAVLVVRCKDCDSFAQTNDADEPPRYVCRLWGIPQTPDGFCNKGERRKLNEQG